MPEFPTTGPISVFVRLPAGLIDVTAEERSSAQVDVGPFDGSDGSREAAQSTRVDLHGDRLTVEAPDASGFLFRRSPKLRIRVRVPLDSSIEVRAASADTIARGRWSSAQLRTASGDISFEKATGDVTLNSASGDLRVGQVGGRLQLNTASGDANVQHVSDAIVAHTASGDIQIEQADASVDAVTASGDVTLGAMRRGTVNVKSASGDVSIGVVTGTGVWLDITTVSGSTRSDLSGPDPTPGSGQADLTLQVRTMSGDVHIRRVPQPAAA